MHYFIPSFYGNARFWQSDIIPWYYSFSRMEFDDILHQMRIFTENQLPVQMISMTYHPHFRYLRHRQQVLEASPYSIFDAMQGIEHLEMAPLHVEDLEWDDYCDFIYTPFAIVVMRKGMRYAEVEFGQEGFISKVLYFEDGKPFKEHLFDDRGFVSSILYFEDGRATCRAYLNHHSQWQFLEDLDTGKVEINPQVSHRFKQSEYEEIGQVVWEFFDAFIAQNYQAEDTFVIASNPAHNLNLLNHLPEDASTILSFFIERNGQDKLEDYQEVIPRIDLVISDRKDYLEKLVAAYPVYQKRMHHLPSFDTRLKLGISQRKKTSKIFYQMDQSLPINEEGIYQILKFVAETPKTHVVFGYFNAAGEQVEELEKTIETIISQRLSREILSAGLDSKGAENPLEENQEELYRFEIQNYYDAQAFVKELEYTRLLIDLNPQANHYTQIAGISAGIPQLNISPSEYVQHMKNGWILSSVEELPIAAHHYLDTLKYWNESLIHSIERIKENTGKRFVEKWSTWLKESKNGR